MKMFLSLAGVAALALGTVPAAAQHYSSHNRSNHDRGHNARQSHHARWSAGHRFGSRYSYTAFNSLPRTYVTRYRLSPRYRYVYTDGYIYQVDPRTYAITRIINALTGYWTWCIAHKERPSTVAGGLRCAPAPALSLSFTLPGTPSRELARRTFEAEDVPDLDHAARSSIPIFGFDLIDPLHAPTD
jgi:hypothetical protein